MQRRATWILAIASAAVLAAVLLVPGTASANHGPWDRMGMIQLNWSSRWRAGAAGHTRCYLGWMPAVGTLGVPDNRGMRITTTGWATTTGWGSRWTWAGPSGRCVWLADNNSPTPQDRPFVSYTQFTAIRLDVTPVTPTPTPTAVPKPKEPEATGGVVINQETITDFLNENADPDVAKKVQGVLTALNGHNAPPP